MKKETDRRVVKTQAALKTTFKQMLLKTDFDRLSVKAIAEEANVGRKTFYLHYLDKYNLMDAVIDDYFSALDRICMEKNGLDFVSKTKIWFAFFEQHRLIFMKLFQSTGSYAFRNKFLDFTVAQISKKIKDEISEEQLINIRFVSYGINGMIESYVLRSICQDIDVLSRRVGELFSKNMLTDAHQKRENR